MRLSTATAVLAALSGTAAMVSHTSFKRDLRLAAQLGIHPDQFLASKGSINALASADLDTHIKAEYVSVGYCSGDALEHIMLTVIAPN